MQYFAKAIAAFIVPYIMVPLSIIGVTGEMPFESALELLIVSAVTAVASFAAVYMTPNKK